MSRYTRRLSKLNDANSGSILVEMALLLPLLLLLVFGITEFGRAVMTTNVLYSAAREGARVAATGGDSTAVTTRVAEVLDAANVKSAGRAITIAGPGTGADRRITVQVEADFDVLSGTILPISGTLRLQGSTAMRFE